MLKKACSYCLAKGTFNFAAFHNILYVQLQEGPVYLPFFQALLYVNITEHITDYCNDQCVFDEGAVPFLSGW